MNFKEGYCKTNTFKDALNDSYHKMGDQLLMIWKPSDRWFVRL